MGICPGGTDVHTMSAPYAHFGLAAHWLFILFYDRDERWSNPLAFAASDAGIVGYAYHVSGLFYSIYSIYRMVIGSQRPGCSSGLFL